MSKSIPLTPEAARVVAAFDAVMDRVGVFEDRNDALAAALRELVKVKDRKTIGGTSFLYADDIRAIADNIEQAITYATDPTLPCTGSNEPGQPGGSYGPRLDPGQVQRGNGKGGPTTPKPAIIPKPQYSGGYQPRPGLPALARTMVVCSICGNKRCPHATDHKLPCTGSNEPGQPGSRYTTNTEDSMSTLENHELV